MKLIYYILIVSLLISGATAISQKPGWADINTSQTFPTNLAMGTNDITGAGSVTADEVYSGGELQRNQTQAYDAILYIKNGQTVAESSSGLIIYKGTNTSAIYATMAYLPAGGIIRLRSTDTFTLESHVVVSVGNYTFDGGFSGAAGYLPGAVITGSGIDLFEITGTPSAHIDVGFRGIHFKNGLAQLNFTYGGPYIEYCSFDHSGHEAVIQNAAWGSIIKHNVFVSCGAVSGSYPAVVFGTVGGQANTFTQVISNQFETSPYCSIYGRLYDGSVIQNNYLEGCPAFHEIALVTCVNTVISGNKIGATSTTGGSVAGIYVAGGSANIVDNPLVTGYAFGIITKTEGGIVSRNQIFNCVYGIYPQNGTDTVKSAGTLISENVINSCDNGIEIANAHNATIVMNTIVKDAATVYGIRETGTSDYNRILFNRITGGSTARVALIGTHSVAKYNTEYVTESSGASSVLSGQTYKDVAHGLAITPTAQQITITPKEDFHAMYYFVDNINTTHFRFNLNGTALEDLDFGWSIS